MKVVGTIIDFRTYNLCGLRFEGVASEFGANSNIKMEQDVPFPKANEFVKKSTNFEIVQGGNIVSKIKGKDLRSLRMYSTDGKLVSNDVVALHRLVNDNNVEVGVEVYVYCTKQTLKLDFKNLKLLDMYFKPVNYKIVIPSDGKGMYVASKPGNYREKYGIPPYSELKALHVVTKKTNSNDTGASSRKSANVKAKVAGNGINVVGLLDIINEAGGFIVCVDDKDNKYKNTTSSSTVVADGFKPKDYLIARSGADYSVGTMKVNIQLHRMGAVDINGADVPCFTYNTRTVVKDSVNYMKKFTFAVPSDKGTKVLHYIRGCSGGFNLSNAEYDSDKLGDIAKMAEMFFDVKDAGSFKYYTLDLSGVTDISKAVMDTAGKMTIDTLIDSIKKYNAANLAKKVAQSVIKEASESGAVRPSDIFNGYQDLSVSALKKLADAGVNVKTGEYTKRETVENKIAGDDETNAPAKVEYVVNGFDATRITAKVYRSILTDDKAKKAVEKYSGLLDLSKDLTGLKPVMTLAEAQECLKKANSIYYTERKKIWQYSAVVVKKGKMLKNGANWELNESKRAAASKKPAKVKKYVDKGRGLGVALTNVELAD